MEEIVAVKSYVEDLFRYLDTFENNYAEFKTEAFLQTYNGIGAVFSALRKQRDNAVDLDQYLLDKIKQAPLTSSDLRQLTIQVLVTFFESEADIDGQSNKAYSYCRGLRPVKRDVTFFEGNLAPLLFHEGALNLNFLLNKFFLREIGRYLNTFGKPVQEHFSPEAFNSLNETLKFVELERRRQALGEDRLQDRSSLEFQLRGVDAFTKLAQKNSLADKYLTEWAYISKGSFWNSVKAFFSELGSKFRGAFSSSRYFRLVMTQRNPAYLFYGLIIIVFIAAAIYVPMKWQSYEQQKLEQLRERSEQIQRGGGR